MSIDRLSSSDSNYIFDHLLSSQNLSATSKSTLSRAKDGDKDVLDAAKSVLEKSGQSLDAFDTDNNGQLSDSERDELIATLVKLLSNPDSAKTFFDALNHDNNTKPVTASPPASPPAPAATSQSQAPSTQTSSSQGSGAAGAGGGAGASAAAGSSQSKPSAATGGGPAGGASQASEFGTEKVVDPSKNFDSVPGGGYSVSQCAQDIMKMAASDTKERGPQPTPEQAQKLAQGIINGVNNYFDKSTDPKATAQTLIASAWKESKFNFNAGNGGVFQCAANRFDDYKKAHPDSTMTHAQMSTTGDPAASIDVALWAMAHPVAGMGAPSGVSANVPPDGSPQKALYFWNYNNRPLNDGSGNTELDDYMQRTKYFATLVN